MEPYIIAEVGSNWRRDPQLLPQCVEDARNIGVRAIKFQIGLDSLYNINCAPMRWRNTQDYRFPLYMLPELYAQAHEYQLDVCASVLDIDIISEIGPYIDIIKVASGDLVYGDMLQECCYLAKSKGAGLHLAVATGAATYNEIDRAIATIINAEIADYALMRCTSVYPADLRDARLLAFYNRYIGCVPRLGYSDHTLSNVSAITAVGLGYTVFEHHFDPFKNHLSDAPDSCVSFDTEQFLSYSQHIYEATWAMGKVDAPEYTPEEAPEREWARRDSDGKRPLGVRE